LAVDSDRAVGLTETGAATGVLFKTVIAQTNRGFLMGYGPSIGRSGEWSLVASPVIEIGAKNELGIGASSLALLSVSSPNGLTANAHAVYGFAQSLDSTGIGLSWSPYIDSDLGNRGKYYRQPLTLADSASLINLPFGGGVEGASVVNYASLDFADLMKLGLDISGSEKSKLDLDTFGWEHQASLSLDYYLPVYKRVMLALDTGATYSWGDLSEYGASNAVLGLKNSAGANKAWGVSWGAFLGFPIGGHLDMPIYNMFSLTNLLAGIEYRGASAFDSGESFADGCRQSIGLSFIPVLRSLVDALNQPLYSFGISFDLNEIIEDPAQAFSHLPSFYLGAKVPLNYAQLFSY
jgi:hypothetical protein